MALKLSRLSRLFNFGENKEAGDAEEKEDFSPMEQKEEDSVTPVDPLCLQLPQEHALNQLWWLRSEEAGALSMPVLRLGKTGEHSSVVPEKMLRKEMDRLLQMITSTAKARLELVKKAVPEPKEEALGEETENADGTNTSEEEAETTEGTEVLEEEVSIPDLDAMAEVFLTEDEMSAWLFIYPPSGQGQEADSELLQNALNEKKVTYGVEDGLLERVAKDKKKYFQLYLVAEGKQPIDGKDGEIVDFFPRNWKPEVQIDDFGNVDYTELDFVQNINEGDTICEIIDPVEKENGMTVTNREIPAKVGKKPPIPKGRYTKVTEDGSKLIATKSGHVEFSGQGFQVKPVLEIFGNIDYSTGNISFLGDVHISGNVCTGFTVKASGSITIDGVLEAGSVEAGGDLIVRKGIKGDQQLIIRVGRNLFAKYLENTTVCVKERLESDCVINCSVYSNGDVHVCSGRGILVGGVVRASNEVRANIVGSKSEHRTLICLGGFPDEEFELECLYQEIKDLEAEYEKLEAQPDSPTKARKLGMVRMKLSVNRQKEEQFAKYLDDAKKKYLDDAKKKTERGKDVSEKKEEQEQAPMQLVCSMAYGGTEIRIGNATLSLRREVRPCTAVLKEGKICLI